MWRRPLLRSSLHPSAPREGARSAASGTAFVSTKGDRRMIRCKSWALRAVAGLSVAVASVVGVPATAGAAPPERVSFDVSEPAFTDPYLSELCGTTIQVSATGTVEITLWRNEAGLVVRERDRFPNAWTTFSSPETGDSFRIRFEGVSDWEYGTGARIGSEVTI